MNPQGGGGMGGYGGGASMGHGMLSMSMLQSLEQMMGAGPSVEGSGGGIGNMMMSSVQQQMGGVTLGEAIGSMAGDSSGRPDNTQQNQLMGGAPRTDTGSGRVAASNSSGAAPSRYESQKRRDWNTFGQYLKNHRPPLALSRCSGAHVLEFLRYLDQFGKTKVHALGCPFFGHPQPPAPCACPLRQAWGSLDALIGRLRAAYEEHGGKPESNPFGARAVRLYLREVRETQAKARGIAYEKKKRKRPPPHATGSTAGNPPPPPPGSSSTSSTTDHGQSLLSDSSSLLIPSFN
ncbi:hypothetical protein GOP47_0012905 [Adiantum capillus-veneris]|uniref:ALOG domain-containing protein n=1 Tax=Adiantum capillus-veneris TaxID=13818 RepID=A0A9D4URJ8_ADICA|nr:hypothetical protein GOP47_0012905 [Adiantum capillus-veneris]